jgi:hypothetical protein
MRNITYRVVVKNDLVLKLAGATAAPDPKARYVKFVFARCRVDESVEAGGGTLSLSFEGFGLLDAMIDLLCMKELIQ